MPHRLVHYLRESCVGRPCLATIATSATGIVAWIGSVNWVGGATATVGVISILVLGFNHLRQQLRTQHLKWEEENRGTLTGQLEAAHRDTARLHAQLAELTESIKAERKSLHAQRNEMQAQSNQLHEQIADVTEQLIDTTRELSGANRKIGELMGEIEKLRLGTARQTTAVLKEVAGAKRQTTANTVAIAELQQLSGDNITVPKELLDDTPPHGMPVVKG